ncbi:MAG: DNA polymerase III subunit gamma/tau [Actinobacteria bacterium]|nr:DNA polymerase III subunit gamma/tau [Actinomycetota bacterium]MBS1900242.1 DNA polymerase III subunit gamma/tau [Actinomycetota bacterium]
MAFQALYRKYRPQRFGELVGQDHITTALRNAVKENRVGHAYLFSGPRGNGKTTTARILAKALNCLELGDDGEPCGQCENCVAIAAGTFPDLIEMDAASNRGVDDARDLVARINLGLGATAKRKVYLLDEVHMLTKDASNTLLKTLEEPPPHVVFVLATTEPERVLPTIRSRTQHFEFSYLTVEQLTGLLASLLDDEGVQYEPDALAVVARAAGGSARDSESLLDLVLAAGGPVTVAAVEAALGGAPFESRMEILDAVAAQDVAGVLTGVAALLEQAHDPRRIAEGLLVSLRDAFVLVASGGRVDVDEPEEVRARLVAAGEALGNAALVRSLETLGQAVVDMRGTDAADPRLVLEIALVRLARRETNVALQSLADRVERIEARLNDGVPPVAAPAPRAPAVAPAPEPPRPPVAADPGSPEPAPAEPAPARAAARPKGLGALRRERAGNGDPAAALPLAAEPAEPADDASGAVAEVVFDLDDAIVAWAAVLGSLPRRVQAAIQEAQPVRVDGNVIVFGVARSHLDTVKPKFRKDADAIREAFIASLGTAPRFQFTQQEWNEGEGPPHRRRAAEPADEAPPLEDEPIDLYDPEELVDAPVDAGAAVDSVTRLTDAFGGEVVEEQPRS